MARSINLPEELRGFRGLWQYLITRSQLKARIEIERERSRAYADHRDRLPDNAELMDYEDTQGRKLWIRKNEPSGMPPGPPATPVMIVQVAPGRVTGVPCLAGDELTGEITP